MTKVKKETLSLEELFDQAIVKEEDRPYEVPGNWVWTRFESICSGFQYGYTDKASYETIGPKFIRITDLSDGIIDDSNAPYCKLKDSEYEKYKIYKDDILIARMGSVGENGVANEDIEGVFASYLIRLKPLINAIYLKNILQSNLYWSQIFVNKKGTTRANINANTLRAILCPLPTLSEQARIVEVIESLFEKLNTAKELVQNALDSFESRKAAILHKAFTGELTAGWREENGVSLDEWEETSLGKVCKSIFDGDHMPPPKSENGVPFLVISNINKGYLNFENTRFVPKEYYEKISDTRKPELGDVLYSIVGSYGISVLVDDDREFCFQRHMALLKPHKIESKFLWYLLQTSDMYNKATEIATGTAQLTVPIKGLREIKFFLPKRLEQQETVRILDSLFENEQRAKELCDVIEKIYLMKKAILARAFRGELGTNNPEEESAVELLKEILKEKI